MLFQNMFQKSFRQELAVLEQFQKLKRGLELVFEAHFQYTFSRKHVPYFIEFINLHQFTSNFINLPCFNIGPSYLSIYETISILRFLFSQLMTS